MLRLPKPQSVHISERRAQIVQSDEYGLTAAVQVIVRAPRRRGVRRASRGGYGSEFNAKA